MSESIFCVNCHAFTAGKAVCPVCGEEQQQRSDGKGKMLWNLESDARIHSALLVVGDLLIVGTQNGMVQAFDLRTRREAWRYSLSPWLPSTEMCVRDRWLYVGTMDSRPLGMPDKALIVLDIGTGQEVWRCQTPARNLSAPAIDGDTVYVAGSDNRLYAIDAEQGSVRWTAETAGFARCAPAVCGRRVIVVGRSSHTVQALDADDRGQEMWRVKAGGELTTSPVVAGGTVYLACWDGTLSALDAEGGVPRWRFQVSSRRPFLTSRPAVGPDLVYVGCRDHFLYAVDRDGGQERWKWETKRTIFATPLVVQDLVLCASEDHVLYALDAGEGCERWRFETKGRLEATPAVAGDVVLAGDKDGRLYAIRWRSPAPVPVQQLIDRGHFEQAAVRYALEGAYRPAAQIYLARLNQPRRAAELYRQAQMWPESAAAYEQAGAYRLALEDYGRAGNRSQEIAMLLKLNEYLEAAQLIDQDGDPERAAQLYERGGELKKAALLYERSEDLDAALRIYDRLRMDPDIERIMRQQGNMRGLAEKWEKRGEFARAASVYEHMGDGEHAVRLYEALGQLDKVAAIWEKSGDLGRAAEIWERLGERERAADLYDQCGDTDHAIRIYRSLGKLEKAAAILESSERWIEAADLQIRLDNVERAAWLYEKGARYERAMDLFTQSQNWPKARELCRRIGDWEGEGEFALQMEDWRGAAEAFVRAAEDLEHKQPARSKARDERIADLYERAQKSYKMDYDEDQARMCGKKIIRYRRLPDIELDALDTSLKLGERGTILLQVRNVGHGPARMLSIRSGRPDLFEGEVEHTQTLSGLRDQDTREILLSVTPMQAGRVPLYLTVDFMHGDQIKSQPFRLFVTVERHVTPIIQVGGDYVAGDKQNITGDQVKGPKIGDVGLLRAERISDAFDRQTFLDEVKPETSEPQPADATGSAAIRCRHCGVVVAQNAGGQCPNCGESISPR